MNPFEYYRTDETFFFFQMREYLLKNGKKSGNPELFQSYIQRVHNNELGIHIELTYIETVPLNVNTLTCKRYISSRYRDAIVMRHKNNLVSMVFYEKSLGQAFFKPIFTFYEDFIVNRENFK